MENSIKKNMLLYK